MTTSPEEIEAAAKAIWHGDPSNDNDPWDAMLPDDCDKDNPRMYATAALEAAAAARGNIDSFELQAKLTTGETVIVKVSGYSNIRQGCAALVKVADVQTLSHLIANVEDDEEDQT
jgi:hypothetical protein